MPSLDAVTAALERLAPLRLAAEWDAVGLLVGRPPGPVDRVMTCLSLTPDVAAEAARERADLVVAHHPLPFRPVGRITAATTTGRVLLELVAARCGVWSAHTAWDSAVGGINDQLCGLAGLADVVPLAPDAELPAAGAGRAGTALAGVTVADLARRLAGALGATSVQRVGDPGRAAGRVAVACGSGGDFVAVAAAAGCATFVTGEIKLHDALEARGAGLAVVALGHHASERFAMEVLAERLAAAVPGLATWASRDERDPLAPLG